MIAEAAVALELEATAESLMRVVHPHPTLSEAIMEAAHGAVGHPIHV
jgi:dihydrolipoamide dehydrogenase